MGKFVEGWERAHAAAEAREAEKRRRAERMAAALKQLSDALAVDGEALAQQSFNLHMEHGALVLRRVVEPVAGVTFDPANGKFKIHIYVTGSETEMEAGDHEECALKLGEFAHSLQR